MAVALPFLMFYASLSIYLGFYDMRTGLLPDRMTCPLLWGGLIFHQCFFPTQLSDAVWGAVTGYAGFAFFYWGYWALRKREGLGYGDVKFLAALGAWHGWGTLPILVFWAALLACAGVAVLIFIKGRAALKNPLPFGPFLAAAGFITGCHKLTFGALSWSLQSATADNFVGQFLR